MLQPKIEIVGFGQFGNVGLCTAGPGKLDTRKEYIVVTSTAINTGMYSTGFNNEFIFKAESKVQAYNEIKNRIPSMIKSLEQQPTSKPNYVHSIHIVLCEENV